MQDYVDYLCPSAQLKKTHHHRDLNTQSASSSATRRAQLSQTRACPHGTNANPWRGAVKHTSQDFSWTGGSDTDEFDADDVVAVAVV